MTDSRRKYGPVPQLRVRLPLRAARGLLPAPETGFVVCDRDTRVLAAGRGVFELTGYRDADLIGRNVVEALALSDTSPIEVVREWGVRKLGQELEIRTRAGREKRVTADFFPAYDDDGGLLVALTPR